MDLSDLAQSTSKGLARRLSRRGAFGTVGRVAIATLGGGVLAEGLLAEPAAASASCSTNESIPCDCLSGGNNSCPSGTTQGGCWIACVSGLCGGTHAAQFCDCCGGCSGLPCSTKTNCHTWNHGLCSCCFNAALGAYCSDNHFSKCRTYSCTPITCHSRSIKAAQMRYGGEVRLAHPASA
jgi:hypothetical protein